MGTGGAAESDSDAAGLEDSDGKAIPPVPDDDEENAQSEASDDVRIQTYQSTFGKVCACLGVCCVVSVVVVCVRVWCHMWIIAFNSLPMYDGRICALAKKMHPRWLAEKKQTGEIDDDDFENGADSLASEVLDANDEEGEEDKDEDEDDDRYS